MTKTTTAMTTTATTNGTLSKPTSVLDLPPGHPGRPYIIPSLSGEIIYIPCSKSATRLLVTGKETDNAFAVVGSGGSHSAPIGFHYHHSAHDVFLCIKGSVNVWAGDDCRTLTSGDFASVPPGTIHQYQILGTHTEFLGLIVPGGWEEFFRFIGEPYNTAGPLWPMRDDRNPLEVLLPKLKAAAEKFDMVPCPRHVGAVEPQPWQDNHDNTLPETPTPYFLRHNTGPAFLVGDGQTIVRPLAGMKESAGRFSVASIEGSSFYSSSNLSTSSSQLSSLSSTFTFHKTHHCFQVAEGRVEFTLGRTTDSSNDKNGDSESGNDGSSNSNSSSSHSNSGSSSSSSILHQGETIYIPSTTPFRLRWCDRFTKVYVFSNGAGLAEVLMSAVGRKQEAKDGVVVLLPELRSVESMQQTSDESMTADRLAWLQREFEVEIEDLRPR